MATITLSAVQMESVACRSIPRPDGKGADGCGKGWVQKKGERKVCPTCNRPLHVTGSYLEASLR